MKITHLQGKKGSLNECAGNVRGDNNKVPKHINFRATSSYVKAYACGNLISHIHIY